jgi:hypothetical protein
MHLPSLDVKLTDIHVEAIASCRREVSVSCFRVIKHWNYFNFRVKFVCGRKLLIEDVPSIALT